MARVMVDGVAVEMELPAAPPPAASPLRPLAAVREYLTAAGKWDAMVAYLMARPAVLLKVLSSEHPGQFDTSDPDAVAALAAVGLTADALPAP